MEFLPLATRSSNRARIRYPTRIAGYVIISGIIGSLLNISKGNSISHNDSGRIFETMEGLIPFSVCPNLHKWDAQRSAPIFLFRHHFPLCTASKDHEESLKLRFSCKRQQLIWYQPQNCSYYKWVKCANGHLTPPQWDPPILSVYLRFCRPHTQGGIEKTQYAQTLSICDFLLGQICFAESKYSFA